MLEKILKDINKLINLGFDKKEFKFVEQIEKNIDFLKLRNKNKKCLLIDLINNAERRIKEGKYDDAVARLYRCVELIAQIRLLDYDFNEIDEKEKNKFNLEKIKNKGIDTEKYEKYADENGRVKLGMEKKFELLKDLGWAEAEEIYLQNNTLKNLLQKRNNSILAHGLEPVKKETAEQLFENVKKISEYLFKDNEENLNIEEKLKQAKFMRFK